MFAATAIVILAFAFANGKVSTKEDNVLRFDSQHVVSPEQEINHLMELFRKPLIPERYKPISFFKLLGLDHLKRLQAFQWKNCGGSVENVHSLSIGPDPLQFPGTVTISAAFSLNATLRAPLSAELVIDKKIAGIPVRIPCINNVGSCTYQLCAVLEDVADCPAQLTAIGIDCKCPLQKNDYKLPPFSFDIGAAALPSGDYEVEGKVKDGSGKMVACLQLALSVA